MRRLWLHRNMERGGQLSRRCRSTVSLKGRIGRPGRARKDSIVVAPLPESKRPRSRALQVKAGRYADVASGDPDELCRRTPFGGVASCGFPAKGSTSGSYSVEMCDASSVNCPDPPIVIVNRDWPAPANGPLQIAVSGGNVDQVVRSIVSIATSRRLAPARDVRPLRCGTTRQPGNEVCHRWHAAVTSKQLRTLGAMTM
jgi:hypothetical protein